MWTQPHCRIGSACPPNETATKGVMNERASHGAVALDVSRSVSNIPKQYHSMMDQSQGVAANVVALRESVE